ncbi:MAG: cysteine--tRNA ligase [Elusimicrobiaceae bacterium]|nr:cysteine--tRNA ligase [Elusimicrobiaceae bacterium]MBP5616712.1 cysteine--tRNA ligase [Elusimicrobiaceae bacterium]
MYLYNTATHHKDEFKPQNPAQVTMYCCGPTVYNYAHIGNLRTYIFEDLLARTLRLQYSLKHVMNITDVGHLVSDSDEGEDKMEVGAAREGKSAWDIAKFYEEKFWQDYDALHCSRPTVISRATQHIQEMINLVKTLEEKGYTYRTSDGIYYDTSKFARYDALVGHAHISGLQGGARVELSDEKRNPTDFALWKFSPKDKKRQMEWDSPWGVGFPGWHIECSAMAMKYLGHTLDIHCGGVDHVTIHHTNEIAQSEAATGQKYVNYWVHGEFLILRSGKMSKSGGTFVTLEVLKEKGYEPLAYRYFCLGAHYRTQLEFSYESMDSAAKSLKNLRALACQAKEQAGAKIEETEKSRTWKEKFMAAMQDDLNAPKALAITWEAVRAGDLSAAEKTDFLQFADTILALDLFKVTQEKPLPIPAQVQALLDQRKAARAAKDWAASDALRAQINQAGYEVKDTPQGQVACKK